MEEEAAAAAQGRLASRPKDAERAVAARLNLNFPKIVALRLEISSTPSYTCIAPILFRLCLAA